MLTSIKSWLNQDKISHDNPEIKLDITKLMVGMMIVDEHLDEFEWNEIQQFLKDQLDISDEKSHALITQMQHEMEDEKAFSHAAQHIMNDYSMQECAYILSIVWRIALIDHEVTFQEEQYLNKLATLFNVPSDMLEALKKQQERDFPNLDERDRYEEF